MRPRLHFTAASGWINDPHGLTYHDGRYHLFHQYVPDSTAWAPSCHWGHAVSNDLLTWEHLPVALAPGDGDDGIWTGSLVVDGDDALILYTSVSQPDLAMGRVRAARSSDWLTWTKGPVVASPPPDLDLVAFRDPFVIREGDDWRMFVGAADRSGRALALTYTSPDLDTWPYDGIAASRSTDLRDPVWMGALWECPQILEVDGHWVLVTSVWDDDVLHHASYGIGTYADGRFEADHWGQLSFGLSYYAPSFFRDADDRPCLIFWMRDVTGDGWAGCLSAPYVLSVTDGRLIATPHPQVDTSTWTPSPGEQLPLSSATLVAGDGSLTLERPGHESWSMPWTGGPVQVLVDGPVLEVSSADGVLGGAVDITVSPG